MAVKDILADKTKKRTIGILGTIIIILATAGIFWHEAGTIAVKEPPSGGGGAGNATTTTGNIIVNETGNYHDERDGTISGSGPAGILSPNRPNQKYEPFTINSGAKKAVITVSSDKDVDLYILDPEGNVVASSATAETTETVEITSPPAGNWNADILHYSSVPRPMNSAEYHLVIDVYYQ